MFAIFETGGKQYKVEKDDIIFVEKLNVNEGETVEFDKVLLTSNSIGTPFVDGAKVSAEVVKHGKGKKIIVYKFRDRISRSKKQGHRQPYTQLKITSV